MAWLRGWKTRIVLFLAVVGPGIITANVDNDAGGIATYSQAGAQFGYLLLWIVIPMTVALVVIQEMSARMGAVTGKGLSDLNSGRIRVPHHLFCHVRSAGDQFRQCARRILGCRLKPGTVRHFQIHQRAAGSGIGVAAGGKGSYKSVEKVFLAASGFYICYIIAGLLAGPAWKEALVATVKAPQVRVFSQPAYLYMALGVIGTTIAPWMQFYLQASVVEKGVSEEQYGASRVDVVAGCLFTDVVAWFIIVACAATLFAHGHTQIRDGADAAQALRPLAGDYAYILFAAGLLNASVFAASILPLSTAYTVCEGLGLESGVDKRFREAPVFYWLYTILIVAGAGVTLIPNFPLIKITILSQVINGAVLPLVLIFMLLLINKRELMGRHTNSWTLNVIAWATTAVVIAMTLGSVWTAQ